MQQVPLCPKCGSQRFAGERFCRACGEMVIINCPHCGTEINAGFRFCPNCGLGLGEATRQQITGVIPSKKLRDLIGDLHLIGVSKDSLPFKERNWCNALGLYVQYRDLDRYTHGVDGVWVKAGGKYRVKIEGWTDYDKLWEIKKYKPGNWEALVKPTLQIVKWLCSYGGLRIEDQEEFKRAIEGFRKDGKLELP